MRQFLPASPSSDAFESCLSLSLPACQNRLRQRWVYEYATGIGCEMVDLLIWYEEGAQHTRYYVTLGGITIFGYLTPIAADSTHLTGDFLYVPWWQVPRIRLPVLAAGILILLAMLQVQTLYLAPVALIFAGIGIQERLVQRHRQQLMSVLPCLWLDAHCHASLPRLKVQRR